MKIPTRKLKKTPHEYKIGDKISIKRGMKRKYGQDPYEGPYSILKVNTNEPYNTVSAMVAILLDVFHVGRGTFCFVTYVKY